MKNLKVKIALGLLILALSFLSLLAVLEQSLSVELMKIVRASISLLLWVVIPMVVTIISLILLGAYKEKFRLLVYVSSTLLFISNITFLLFLNLSNVGFGIIIIVLCVWGASFLFIVTLIIKLIYAYFINVNIKEILEDIFQLNLIKSLLLSILVTFLLFHIYLLGNAITVYKTLQELNVEEKEVSSLFSFYKPSIYEIRLSDGRRWSYGSLKFVDNGR